MNWEGAIGALAGKVGVELDAAALDALALHAREVLAHNERLHLTSITDPNEFLSRHLGESLTGAAMLDAASSGVLLDLGSGNGYPGLPVAAARPGLRPLLAETSAKKAAFLRTVVERGFPAGSVLERNVQRPADLDDARLDVIVTRAAGGWERVLPRLASCLAPDGALLVWAGESMETVARRNAWGRYRLVERRPLPGRDRSWVWRFERA